MASSSDTIYALSSGHLPAGVAVVRISGPRAAEICHRLTGNLPAPRIATLRTIHDRNDHVLDQAIVVWFPGPASFTGEDCLEVHVHGGRAVVVGLFDVISNGYAGIRHAEAGEFSRRAFENGKLDLTEIEGLGDLISAETEMQRRLAVEQMRGGLSRVYAGWADRLTRGRALIEAELDFSDEEDIPGAVSDQIWSDMRALVDEIDSHTKGIIAGEIIRDGFKVVIAGPPNAGKSSLLNTLAKRDVAIVTDVAGTTRDVLKVDLNLGGYVVHLVDTAGLRESIDVVEAEGIRRARHEMESAHLVLLLSECGQVADPSAVEGLNVPFLCVGTKLDLHDDNDSTGFDVVISSSSGFGLPELQDLLLKAVIDSVPVLNAALPNRLRHKDFLDEARRSIDAAVRSSTLDLELRAELLRQASNSLGRVTGRVDVEDLLDVIFREFCVGK
ncbi:tRNA uridine-5-carboxymethylaminomethyl(34) synthesis GTPase MnmE [Rhizobium sp. PAMB 3174]